MYMIDFGLMVLMLILTVFVSMFIVTGYED